MLKEYRSEAKGFADLLNYAVFVSEGILLLKDGGLCFGLFYRGPDANSIMPEELATLSAQLNSLFAQLGNGWMLHADWIRQTSCEYVAESACHFPDPVSYLIDQERRQNYLRAHHHFESYYAMVFTYRPPKEIEARFKKIFSHTSEEQSSWQNILDFVSERKIHLLHGLSTVFWVEEMNSPQLLNHLQQCLRGESGSLLLPKAPIYIDSLLGHADVFTGFYPCIEDKNIRVVSLVGYPGDTTPGILQRLDALPFEFRLSHRFIFLDQANAKKLLQQYRRYWLQARQSLFGLLKEALFPNLNTPTLNLDAQSMLEDVQVAQAEAESGLFSFGFYTLTLLLMHKDAKVADEQCHYLLKEIEQVGFNGKIERINAFEAYLGSLPGHGYQNLRRPLIHSLNFSDLLPVTSVWAGLNEHPCRYYGPHAPPLLYAQTEGATPFRLYLHQQDVAHTLIVGDTGSGKSTLVGLLMAQHLRYKDAQIFLFDKGYSAYVLTQALQGVHYDLANPDAKVMFCPLGEIETENNFFAMLEWLEMLFGLQGYTLTAEQRQELQAGLARLQSGTFRSLTHLQSTLQDPLLKKGLDYFTLSGPMGIVFDGEMELNSNARVQVFEMNHLLERGVLGYLPTLLYLFHRIELSLTGQPTLIFIEEGHRFLQGKFAEKLDVWLRELRKKNAAVVFITQHLNEIMASDLKHVLLNSCKTKIFLPNRHAHDALNAECYRTLGLTDYQLYTLATAQPKKHYFYHSPIGARLLDLTLGSFALSFISVDEANQREQVKNLQLQYGDQWIEMWLLSRGLASQASEWRQLRKNLASH